MADSIHYYKLAVTKMCKMESVPCVCRSQINTAAWFFHCLEEPLYVFKAFLCRVEGRLHIPASPQQPRGKAIVEKGEAELLHFTLKQIWEEQRAHFVFPKNTKLLTLYLK